MTVKDIYICSYNEVLIRPYIVKWIDKLKDEVVIFMDENQQIKIFSSICPHFGGEVIYDEKKKNLDVNGMAGIFVQRLVNAPHIQLKQS